MYQKVNIEVKLPTECGKHCRFFSKAEETLIGWCSLFESAIKIRSKLDSERKKIFECQKCYRCSIIT